MKFLDQAKIYIRSGDGGAGAISFRREKFIEFGGCPATQVIRRQKIQSHNFDAKVVAPAQKLANLGSTGVVPLSGACAWFAFGPATVAVEDDPNVLR